MVGSEHEVSSTQVNAGEIGIVDGILQGQVLWTGQASDDAILLQIWVDGHPRGIIQATLPVDGQPHARSFCMPLGDVATSRVRVTLRSAHNGRIVADGYVIGRNRDRRWSGINPVASAAASDTHVIEAALQARVGPLVTGWAQSVSHPDSPLVLDLQADGHYVDSVIADPARSLVDVASGVAQGPGFFFDLGRTTRPIPPGAALSVSLAADGSPLPIGMVEAIELPPEAASPTERQQLDDFMAAFRKKADATYTRWLRQHDASSPTMIEAASAFVEQEGLDEAPITILVVDAANASPSALAATLDSVSAQILPPCDLVVGDAATLSEALTEAGGRHVLPVSAGDLLAPTALVFLLGQLRSDPSIDLLYSDEDRIDEKGHRAIPYFKGSWDVDLALGQDYFCRAALVPRSTLAGSSLPSTMSGVVGALLAKVAGPDAQVRHLPFVLYHRRGETIGAAAADIEEAIAVPLAGVEIEQQDGVRRAYWPLPATLPKVSLLVPTRDRIGLLKQCVDGILRETDYRNFEIIILDNDSVEQRSLDYFARIGEHPQVRVLRCPGLFNFSAINNLGAAAASGDIIGLINNDLKVIDGDWLEIMVRHAVRPDVGAVGARLLYGDGRIQHAGLCLGVGGIASHTYKRCPGDYAGHGNRLRVAHAVEGVTAACMLVRREVWNEVDGLDEDLPVAYNDVDLCLKIRAKQYRIILDPHACLYHLESASRGAEDTPQKKARFQSDKTKMEERWAAVLTNDTALGPNWSLTATDAMPAFPPRVTPPFPV